MISVLRRYGQFFNIYCKTGVILNISIFHSRDATIQKGIGKSFRNSSKINANLTENGAQKASE